MTQNAADYTFDADLLQRYDANGPRYTSYPTAPHFRSDFDVGAYRKAALLSNEARTPLSVYVHIPFCASPCFYCGCTKVITRNKHEGVRYVTALEHEIELQAALFSNDRRLEQIHFGGGTPTFLSVAEIGRILAKLDREFTTATAGSNELSIEIDPRTVDAQIVASLADLGFNRISLGIQDFDPQVQAAVNRVQSIEDTRRIVAAARKSGIDAINFDLIYGLPRQSTSSFARTLDQVVDLRPTRVAAYGYAHMPELFKPQRRINAEELPTPSQRLELLRLTIERLNAAGYLYIGMDHFALPEDPLAKALLAGDLHRNFQGYSSQADCDLIGLGVSSIGKVGNAYAQNVKTLSEYYARIDQHRLAVARGLVLTSDDRLRREVIQALMCRGQVDFAALEAEHCVDFAEYFADELDRLVPLQADGLVELSGRGITVTSRGRLLVRHVAMVFDAYLGIKASVRYSKAI